MAAKAVCKGCPVIENCLRWAITAREPYGVWGGLSAEEREGLTVRRPA
jgi:WhiB family redox-sensing transcriptional regulator